MRQLHVSEMVSPARLLRSEPEPASSGLLLAAWSSSDSTALVMRLPTDTLCTGTKDQSSHFRVAETSCMASLWSMSLQARTRASKGLGGLQGMGQHCVKHTK